MMRMGVSIVVTAVILASCLSSTCASAAVSSSNVLLRSSSSSLPSLSTMRLRGGSSRGVPEGPSPEPPSKLAEMMAGLAPLREKVLSEFEEKDGSIVAGLDEDFDEADPEEEWESEDYNATLKRIAENIAVQEGMPKTRLPTLEELENKGMLEAEWDGDENGTTFQKHHFGAYWEYELHEESAQHDTAAFNASIEQADIIVPDAVSDMQKAVNAAVTSADRGDLVIRGGEYRWEGRLRVEGGIRVRGSGGGRCKLKGMWHMCGEAGGSMRTLALNFTAVGKEIDNKVFDGYCITVEGSGEWNVTGCDVRSLKGSSLLVKDSASLSLRMCGVGGFPPPPMGSEIDPLCGFRVLTSRACHGLDVQGKARVRGEGTRFDNTGQRYGHAIHLCGESETLLDRCSASHNIDALCITGMASANLSRCEFAHSNDYALWAYSLEDKAEGTMGMPPVVKQIKTRLCLKSCKVECEMWLDSARPAELVLEDNVVCKQDFCEADEEEGEKEETWTVQDAPPGGGCGDALQSGGGISEPTINPLRGGSGDQQQETRGEGGGPGPDMPGINPMWQGTEEIVDDPEEDAKIQRCIQVAEAAGLFDRRKGGMGDQVDDTKLPAGPLKNRYFALRHGESEANAAGIIVSDPNNGVPSYGVTAKGREQAAESAEKFMDEVGADRQGDILIYHSDFKRARETAEVFAEVCGVDSGRMHVAKQLRERRFGILELGDHARYNDVWEHDAKNGGHNEFEVEAARDVRFRTAALIRILEVEHQGKIIVLASHGDALQILQTAFRDIPVTEHRTLEHLVQAECRELTKPA